MYPSNVYFKISAETVNLSWSPSISQVTLSKFSAPQFSIFDLSWQAQTAITVLRSTGYACANAAGRVFECNALGGVVLETFGSEEEGMGS